MSDTWTSNQIEAITRSGENLLVSAAAGSRKDCRFGRKNN